MDYLRSYFRVCALHLRQSYGYPAIAHRRLVSDAAAVTLPLYVSSTK
jgi:hypothetical protein